MKTINVKQDQLLELITGGTGRIKIGRQKGIQPTGEYCLIEGNPSERTTALVMPNGDVIHGRDNSSPRIREYLEQRGISISAEQQNIAA